MQYERRQLNKSWFAEQPGMTDKSSEFISHHGAQYA